MRRALAVLLLLLVRGVSEGQANSWVLPSSAYRLGAGGAEYRTDVRILNQGSAPVTVSAVLYDQASGETLGAPPFSIAPRSQAALDNVHRTLFGRMLEQGAWGPIRFDSSSTIVVSSSINNVNGCGNGAVSGQWLPGLDPTQALRGGTIGHLGVSASATSGYRTNVVFMNPGTKSSTVTVKVRRGDGSLLSQASLGPLGPNGFVQAPLDAWTTFPGVAGLTDTNLWLEFASTEPVFSFASVINNASGDPFSVLATNDGSAAAGPEVTLTLPGGVPLVLVRIPAGTFLMGSPDTERNRFSDETLHPVTLTRDYFIGKTEVTQGQWRAVMGTAMSSTCGAYGVGDVYPVSCVSWSDVAGSGGFLDRLNAHLSTSGQGTTGKVRLPTEAEWERAARGGTETRFSFGDAVDCDDACGACTAAAPYLWWCGNASSSSGVSASKAANPYGLSDVHGNVWEWVQDWYGPYATGPTTDPAGPDTGTARAYRGGGWYNALRYCRSAARYGYDPSSRAYYVGFRIAR